MNLKETLQKIKDETPEQYRMSVSIIKRKAQKGLIEGYSPDDVDAIIDEIESEDVVEKDEIDNTLTGLINELSEAVEKYDYLCEDEKPLTDNDIEMLSLYEFLLQAGYSYGDILEEGYKDYDDYDEYKMSREEKQQRRKAKKKAKEKYKLDHPIKSKVETGAKIAGGAAGAGIAGGLTANAILTHKKNKAAFAKYASEQDAARAAGEKIFNTNVETRAAELAKKLKDTEGLKTGGELSKFTEIGIEKAAKDQAAAELAGTKNALIQAELGKVVEPIPQTTLASKIATGVGAAAKNVGKWLVAHPGVAGLAGGAALVGGGILAAKLIKKIKERRARRLSEGIDSEFYFSEETLLSVATELEDLTENEILALAESNELMDLLISEAINFTAQEALNESATNISCLEESLNDFDSFRTMTLESLLK